MGLWQEKELLIEITKFTLRDNGRMDWGMEEELGTCHKENTKDNGKMDLDMVMEMFKFILLNT